LQACACVGDECCIVATRRENFNSRLSVTVPVTYEQGGIDALRPGVSITAMSVRCASQSITSITIRLHLRGGGLALG